MSNAYAQVDQDAIPQAESESGLGGTGGFLLLAAVLAGLGLLWAKVVRPRLKARKLWPYDK